MLKKYPSKRREAEALFGEALPGCWRVLGREHSTTQCAYENLVEVLFALGKTKDAEAVKSQYGGK